MPAVQCSHSTLAIVTGVLQELQRGTRSFLLLGVPLAAPGVPVLERVEEASLTKLP